jgi:hypothetical protein
MIEVPGCLAGEHLTLAGLKERREYKRSRCTDPADSYKVASFKFHYE